MTVLALVLRCTRLGAQSLWIDEVLSFGWIGEIDRSGFGSLLHNIHGPLHAAVAWLASRVSTSEASLRLPSVIAGTLAVPAIGLLGRSLFGRAVGLIAALALAVSPFALYYAQEFRNYSFTFLFAIAVLGAGWALVQRASGLRACALGLALLASVTSNLNGLFFAAGLFAWGVWRLRRDRRRLAVWLGTFAVTGVCLLPYGWQITHQVQPQRMVGVEAEIGSDEPLRGETTLHPLAVPYTAFAFAAGYSLGPTLGELRLDPKSAASPRHGPVLLLIAIGFGLPFVVGVWRMRSGRGLLLLPALATCLFTVWLAATNVKPYNVRYLSVALPSFLLFVAYGLWSMRGRWRLVLGGAALVVSVWSCFNYLFVPRYGRDDVRNAVAYTAAEAGPEDAIVQISLTAMLRHYYTQLGARPVHPPAAATRDAVGAALFVGQQAPAGGVVWYLECRPEAIDPAGHLRKALSARARATGVREFAGVRVFRFEMPAETSGPEAHQARPILR